MPKTIAAKASTEAMAKGVAVGSLVLHVRTRLLLANALARICNADFCCFCKLPNHGNHWAGTYASESEEPGHYEDRFVGATVHQLCPLAVSVSIAGCVFAEL